jgi:hypothetical protein
VRTGPRGVHAFGDDVVDAVLAGAQA